MSDIRSPLRWAGGKSKVADSIVLKLPESFDTFVDVFCGGGSITIAAKSSGLSAKWHMNDLYYPVIAFYRAIRDHGPALVKRLVSDYRELNTLELKRKKFEILKIFNTLDKYNLREDYGLLNSAADFWFLNRCSFSGTTQSGGFSESAASGRYTKSAILRVKQLVDSGLLKGTRITCCDFQESILDTRLKGSTLLFIDAPYVTASKLYGNKGDLHEGFDHERLARLLRKTPHRFLMTYDDCPEIRKLYKFAEIEEWDLQYGMGGGNTRRKGQELLIKNY